MSTADRSLIVANDDYLSRMILSAQERVLVVAPALNRAVATALSGQWKKLGSDRVFVTLDLDPEVFRLGYGEFEGLKLLEKTAEELGTMIQRQPGIRIGLIVADQATVVFSPIPALIEAGPSSQEAANAVVLHTTPPTLEKELGLGENGTMDQMVGLDKATKADIGKVAVDLKQNPPQRFDIARTVRVFNAYFQFVEFEMTGTHIGRKTMPIPAELMGLAKDDQTKRRLRANFRIVDEEDALSGERLARAKAWIIKNYVVTLPGYGNVVLRSVKPDFQEKVAQLERCIQLFKREVEKRLEKAMEANRKPLVEALLPTVLSNPPQHWRKFGATHDQKTTRDLLERELAQAAGSAKSLLGDMKLKVLFKDVTFESLSDNKFMEVARKALPTFPQLHEEYDAAKTAQERLPLGAVDGIDSHNSC